MFRLACTDDVKGLFHTGKINNSDLDMAGLFMLWLVSSINFVVQQQFAYCLMGQMTCDKRSIYYNSVSASISIMFEKVWVVTFDAFEHFWVIK